MLDPRCARCAKRAPWASLIGNLSLAIYKLVVGALGASSALVADGYHSLTDVIGSGSILIACRFSDRPADRSHPYGHGKAEFVGAVFVYTLLAGFSVAIFVGPLLSLIDGDYDKPHLVTLLGAAVSVAYNAFMYAYVVCAATKTHSPALMADAFENRADAISSMACIAGILGAILIHPACDLVAAMGVGVIIFWNCVIQIKEASTGLMDSGLGADEVDQLAQAALRHDGVLGIESLRTRRTGPRYWVDVDVRVPTDLTVAESDRIARAVSAEVMASSPVLHDVKVHVVPEAPTTAREPARPASSKPRFESFPTAGPIPHSSDN